MSANWYVLRVKPHKEKSVYGHLTNDSLEVFFPTVRVKPKNPRNAKIKPYFPGYLFIHVDLAALGVNKFKWMSGAIGLVEFGGDPAVVPDSLVAELQTRIADIDAAGGLMVEKFKRGEKVRIVSGPFAGYEAIFDMSLPDQDRVQVLMAFLSEHPQPLKLQSDDVEKLD